ncbi:cysteine rich with EGF like domains isoform X2 [Brevipalpus obovatus]|uniref:cysteine rich with EGF like domains isoform X2 n=1 Tax=Brevipalpus obovatus TaxID=246614 RepID=UPI003D9F64F1
MLGFQLRARIFFGPLERIEAFQFLLLVFFMNIITTHGLRNTPRSQVKGQSNYDQPANVETTLGPCHLCRQLVRSFEKANRELERAIARNPTGELDAQAKFSKIKSRLCSGASEYRDECLGLLAQSESILMEWYLSATENNQRLHDYLCVDSVKLCCPDKHYGPDCSPCPLNGGLVCSGHGTCVGNGTRKGSGKCKCAESHVGELCRRCSNNHYSIRKDQNDIHECEKCDRSCFGQCKSGGPMGCIACNKGYSWDPDIGCMDIDECMDLPKNPCKKNTFCINTEGSFECFECDKACDGCHADGPDNCRKCAPSYKMNEGICVGGKMEREEHLEASRYATYVGLCIATCIIFRKNIFIASGIGLLVALYISAAEYTVRELTGVPSIFERLPKILVSWF